jgi:hypothetical protein
MQIKLNNPENLTIAELTIAVKRLLPAVQHSCHVCRRDGEIWLCVCRLPPILQQDYTPGQSFEAVFPEITFDQIKEALGTYVK